MADLAARILAAIVQSTSQRPARAADVAAQVGGAEPEFWAALEALTATRQINSALIHRPAADPEPWLAIWPTGVLVDRGAWRNEAHSALFVPQRPLSTALAEASGPRAARVRRAPAATQRSRAPLFNHEEKNMKPEQPASTGRGYLQRSVMDALAASQVPMLCAEIAHAIESKVENVFCACRGLVKKGLVERLDGPRPTYRLADLAAQPAAPAPEEAPTIDVPPLYPDAGEALKPASDACDAWKPEEDTGSHDGYRYDPAAEHDGAAEFALWDNGNLDIVAANRVLRLARADVRRLALLLGVPGAAL